MTSQDLSCTTFERVMMVAISRAQYLGVMCLFVSSVFVSVEAQSTSCHIWMHLDIDSELPVDCHHVSSVRNNRSEMTYHP